MNSDIALSRALLERLVIVDDSIIIYNAYKSKSSISLKHVSRQHYQNQQVEQTNEKRQESVGLPRNHPAAQQQPAN